jgi:hypothetical protein
MITLSGNQVLLLVAGLATVLLALLLWACVWAHRIERDYRQLTAGVACPDHASAPTVRPRMELNSDGLVFTDPRDITETGVIRP